MAADSAVMLIDVAKGVEAQTKKLFRVCKDRGIPIFTFVNKIDHFGRNPFDLMDEIENILGIHAYPMNWPIGINGNYEGIYDRESASIELFEKDTSHGQRKLASTKGSADDPIFKDLLDEEIHQSLIDDIELLDAAGDSFDMEKVKNGQLTPMFFGSAMTNFGVKPFLEKFLEMAPKPQPRKCLEGVVDPESEQFTSFVFKIQANMNPQHHDRVVFMRICSGKFEKGMSVTHRQSGKTLRLMQPQRQSGKTLRLMQPQQFLATERTIIDDAYPGDIIGVFDNGTMGVGDTLYAGKQKVTFKDFPTFPPELFARIRAKDSMKRKQFLKGMTQLAQEGAVQIYENLGSMESYIVGAVGKLQFEVLEYRLKHEYGVDLEMNMLPFTVARWLQLNGHEYRELKNVDSAMLVKDHKQRLVLLIANEWQTNWICERNPDITFCTTPDELALDDDEE